MRLIDYICIKKILTMLQEIKIKNFKSFKEEAELSFEAYSDDTNNSVVTMPDGVKLLRFCGYTWSKCQWKIQPFGCHRVLKNLLEQTSTKE